MSSEAPLSTSSEAPLKVKESLGSIYFNSTLLNKLYNNKRNCLKIKFWLVSFNFQNTKIINIKDKKGPYRYINYVGNPLIIIYIPPYVINDKQYINDPFRKKIMTSLIQENPNICDIYINISY